MSFRDYSKVPSSNASVGDGLYIGPNMLRNTVRPALQQFAADGREVWDEIAEIQRPLVVTQAAGASVATRAQLANIASPVANQVANLIERGRSSAFIFDTSDLSALIAADPAQAIYVPGNGGTWVRDFVDLNVEWFGAVAGVPADQHGAFAAAFNLSYALGRQVGYNRHGPAVYAPAKRNGRYTIGAALQMKHAFRFYGDGNGRTAGGTELYFPNSGAASGIIVQGYGTDGEAGFGGTTLGAGGCSIEDLSIVGNSTTSNAFFHALNVRGGVIVQRVFIDKWPGHGIYNFAAFDNANGNTNGSIFRDMFIQRCRWGTWTQGPDANACTYDNVSCNSNRRGGHKDHSFLGCNYYGGFVETNYSNDPLDRSAATYNGKRYHVAEGQEAWCSTNPPTGTTAHNQGWFYKEDGAAESKYVPWTGGLTWFHGAPLATAANNENNRSVFQGIYVEIDQGPCTISGPVVFIGGCVLVPLLAAVGGSKFSYFEGGANGTFINNVSARGSVQAFGDGFFGVSGTGTFDTIVSIGNRNSYSTLDFKSFGVSTASILSGFNNLYINTIATTFLRSNGADVASVSATGLSLLAGKKLSFENVSSLPNAANDAAAATAGVAVGETYRNGSALMVRVA